MGELGGVGNSSSADERSERGLAAGGEGSAVHCYTHAEYLPVLRHDLADVHRTWELGEMVRQYVPARDVETKKL